MWQEQWILTFNLGRDCSAGGTFSDELGRLAEIAEKSSSVKAVDIGIGRIKALPIPSRLDLNTKDVVMLYSPTIDS